jgi:hypothetical protein
MCLMRNQYIDRKRVILMMSKSENITKNVIILTRPKQIYAASSFTSRYSPKCTPTKYKLKQSGRAKKYMRNEKNKKIKEPK